MNKELLIQQIKDGYGDDAAAFISDALDFFVIVPVEPDEEMITNGRNTYIKHLRNPLLNGSYDATVAMYKAMIGQDNES